MNSVAPLKISISVANRYMLANILQVFLLSSSCFTGFIVIIIPPLPALKHTDTHFWKQPTQIPTQTNQFLKVVVISTFINLFCPVMCSVQLHSECFTQTNQASKYSTFNSNIKKIMAACIQQLSNKLPSHKIATTVRIKESLVYTMV